ncbi:unnamed protein product [Didymodactylos carnosus]|uniref:Uncharacterized protein n=1 Tax=Didymodactylos carnosus TaxID=1234261 RepID=A0A815HQ22_9BILA|nr:unnamed protein product [Didymodactylos carnosus]CAF4233627.1 unnamed protein product [Didymodactylos carnosus]
MYYRYTCINKRNERYVHLEAYQLIEPLVGLLRDPLTICARLNASLVPPELYLDGMESIQSRRFLLMSPSAPTVINPLIGVADPEMVFRPWEFYDADYISNLAISKTILFDLGSSYFASWKSNTAAGSTKWFYEYLKHRSIKPDRIIAFEQAALITQTAWEQLPDDVFPIYTLINVGCSSQNNKFNPWKTLLAIAKPQDYVIIKLDIDTSSIELPLVEQIIRNTNISSLIDEMFFEHHVTVNEMKGSWGEPPGTLKDSYRNFTLLRRKGIRMHSWP